VTGSDGIGVPYDRNSDYFESQMEALRDPEKKVNKNIPVPGAGRILKKHPFFLIQLQASSLP
jgi:hypothetical protein